MARISVIHQDRLPPAFIKENVVAMFSKLCTRYTVTGDVPEDVEILIGEPTLLEKQKYSNLKLLIVPHAGVNLPANTAKTILANYPALPILTLHHNAVPTAETGLSLLLATAKQVGRTFNSCSLRLYCIKIVRADKELRAGNWSGSSFANKDGAGKEVKMTQVVLRKKRILILGYGRIGKLVGMACKGLGMDKVK